MKTRLLLLPALLTCARLWAGEPKLGYVVHEWGTFTDVQGADGVQMEWNPLVAPDLPRFVYDREVRSSKARIKGVVVAGKTGTVSRQRMETPVIYFYSDHARTVDVTVRFPEGAVTEWYPLQTAADLTLDLLRKSATKPALHWGNLQIGPASPEAESGLPQEDRPSHYYSARYTDASLVRVQSGDHVESEKFLFYRGLGDFKAPLTVKVEEAISTRVILRNTGGELLKHLYLYQVGPDGGSWSKLEPLKAGESRSIKLPEPRDNAWPELATALRASLVREGLYEKEAAAMVRTWQSSWFLERGLRVLYTLPRAWTDRTLPLELTPAAQHVERVMVARAEVILPASERALLTQLERFAATPESERESVIDDTRALGLGRFIEPTMRRIMTPGREKELSSLAADLVTSAMQPALWPAPPPRPGPPARPLTESELLKTLDHLGVASPVTTASPPATAAP